MRYKNKIFHCNNFSFSANRYKELADSAAELFDIESEVFYTPPNGKRSAGGLLPTCVRKLSSIEKSIGDTTLVKLNLKRKRSIEGGFLFHICFITPVII